LLVVCFVTSPGAPLITPWDNTQPTGSVPAIIEYVIGLEVSVDASIGMLTVILSSKVPKSPAGVIQVIAI
jgi:hypothetical protein